MNKLYKYYVAWNCHDEQLGLGFGSMYIDSNRPLLLETEKDMRGLENYVLSAIYEKSGSVPDCLVIMDWRRMK